MVTTTKAPSFLVPDWLYALQAFYASSGISRTRRHEAAKLGITLPTLEVGRRKFVRGSDAIRYIERLAAIETPAMA